MRSKSVALAALCLAAFTINLDTTIVNVALPTLTRELHASTSQLQWIVDAYNLVFAALLLASGSISDRVGRKGMLVAGLGVFGVASAVGGLTDSAGQLIAARAAMGLGAAMIFPATLSLISNTFTERRERAKAIGLWGATAGIAIASGPIVGGWLLEHFSWTSIFYAMTPVAGVTGVLVALSVTSSRDPRASRIDGPGFLLSIGFVGSLIFTLIEAPARGWGSGRSVAGFAAAAVLLVAFVAWERRTPRPMIDLSLFANPRFTAASGSVTVVFFALAGFIFLITQYFQFFKGYSPFSAGVHLLPVALSVGVASVVGTKLAVRVGTKAVVATGLLFAAAFFLWVSTASVATGYGVIALQMLLGGTGMGLTSAPATEAIMGVVPKDKAGVGSAVNDTTRLLGATLGVAVIGSVYASLYGSRLSASLPAGLPAGLARAAHNSVGAALEIAGRARLAGHGILGTQLHTAASAAFFHGLAAGCRVSGMVAAAGAVMAAVLLPSQPGRSPGELPEAAVATPVGALVD